MEPLGSSKHRIISSEKSDNLTFSLPISISFISLSHLIALPKISSSMLNRSDKSEHPDFLIFS